MAQERGGAGCCDLPGGRVAVVGGRGNGSQPRNGGEAFDPVARTWQPLPPMAHARTAHGAVAVAGGLLAAGGTDDGNNVPPQELFDEASGRWFELPHPMAQPRKSTSAVSVPVAALAPPAAASE